VAVAVLVVTWKLLFPALLLRILMQSARRAVTQHSMDQRILQTQERLEHQVQQLQVVGLVARLQAEI
jgi:hypothetical protein